MSASNRDRVFGVRIGKHADNLRDFISNQRLAAFVERLSSRFGVDEVVDVQLDDDRPTLVVGRRLETSGVQNIYEGLQHVLVNFAFEADEAYAPISIDDELSAQPS